ncbi:MAG: UvrD-helicase domain-containing protein [Sulfurimonas sp.]|nr:UvrD-helicase domain-containing protein [Sulfurimonas sp.]
MSLTQEQQGAVDLFNKPDTKLLLIDACAGSGKSFTLLDIARSKNIKSGLCIVYNKSVSDENKLHFPDTFKSSTIHSLAYRNTVIPFKLKVGFFNARDIKDRIKWEYKVIVVDTLRRFCLSAYLKIDEYAKENETIPLVSKLVTKYIKMMKDGEIDVTHEFYMKFFHMLLANKIIKPKEIDVLMLDECQDSFACTIEIFKLIPAKKKIAVGDHEQAIYSFNHCVNGFNMLCSEPGVRYANLNRTFRVNISDSKVIEKFMQKYLNNSNYTFKGNTHSDTSIKSRAFLTKTNASLVGKMIDLMEAGQGFNLLRPPVAIFELPMILLGLKKDGFINNPEFRHLQDDTNIWHKTKSIQLEFTTPIKYILHLNSSDVAIKAAIRIIIKYGSEKIFNAFEYAKDHYGEKNHEWTLSTVFTSKGFTFDYVEIADDMNAAFFKAVKERKKKKMKEDKFNDILYQAYVISTRHKHKLVNAKFLYDDCIEPEEIII